MLVPGLFQHQIAAYMSSFGAYLMLIRILFLQMFVFNTKMLHICSEIMFLPMFVFNTKLLHICSETLVWCLLDASSMLIFAMFALGAKMLPTYFTQICVLGANLPHRRPPSSICFIIVEASTAKPYQTIARSRFSFV